MTRYASLRIADNNFGAQTSVTPVYSSQLSTYPFTNALNTYRSQVWKPSGYFLIEAGVNDKIYINDGSDKTVTLTASSSAYTTPDLLASHIQTMLNASSSNWTVSYSYTTYCFTIAHNTSATLRLSQTATPVWSTIGFTTSTDLVGASFTADQQRNHTSEFVIWDLGFASPIGFFAAIGPLGQTFGLSGSATIRLQASNFNLWTSTPLDVTITRYNSGLFRFLDDLSDYNYRYWKFSYIDYGNINGPKGIQFGNIYLGSYYTFFNRQVDHGYQKTLVDPTVLSISESGVKYFSSKQKYSKFSSLTLNILERSNKDYLEYLFEIKGLSTPFYISLDPLVQYTTDLDELTKFVYLTSAPSFTHITRDLFTTSLEFEEVI